MPPSRRTGVTIPARPADLRHSPPSPREQIPTLPGSLMLPASARLRSLQPRRCTGSPAPLPPLRGNHRLLSTPLTHRITKEASHRIFADALRLPASLFNAIRTLLESVAAS